MSDPELSFDDGHATAGPATCSRCHASLAEYWAVDGAVLCEGCKEEVLAERSAPEGGGLRIASAVGLGLLGMLAGAAVWYGVAKAFNLEIGLIAILLGFLVGKGIFVGSGRRGGVGYQLLAVALTYLGIGVAMAPFAYGEVSSMALVRLVLSLPILSIIGGGSLIGVIIYGIALYEAFRLTRKVLPLVSGPHAVGAAPA